MEFDDTFANQVRQIRDEQTTRPLKELLPGEWTTVDIIIGPASGARVERVIGLPIELDGDGTYDGDYVQDGNLLILRRDDEIVRMISLGQLAALSEGRYRSDVALAGKDGSVLLRDPDGSPAGQVTGPR
ncbi:MAG: hypothetical protein GEU97_16385 [Actinophytocola sp.]|nr:hypothetical protein [Actinophytocola sp.]